MALRPPQGGWAWFSLALLVAIAFDGALGWSLARQYRALTAQAEKQALTLAQMAQLGVGAIIEGSERTLVGLAQTTQLAGLGAPVLNALLAERRQASPAMASIIIFDERGNVAHHSESSALRPANIADRPYFRHHRQKAEADSLLSPPLVSRFDDHWVMPISHRLDDQTGRFAGIIAAGLSIDYFRNVFGAAVPDDDTTDIALIHDDSRLVTGTPSLPGALSTGDRVDTVALFAHRDGHGDAIAGQGDWIAAFRRVSPYPLTVAVTVNIHAALEPWRREMWASLALAVVGTLAIAVACSTLHVFGSRRRRALARLAEANTLLECRVAERTAELAASENRLRGILDVAEDALVVIDHRGRILDFNPAASRMFGFPPEEILGHSVNQLMPERFARDHDGHLAHHRRGAASIIGGGRELIGRHQNGAEFPIELTVGTLGEEGSLIHVGVIRDITERKRAEEHLTRLATLDGLTGLTNRRTFMERAPQIVAGQSRQPVALLMIDADHFKAINDTYGHGGGDRVLVRLGEILAQAARAHDVAGRLGGEEFALALHHAPDQAAERVAARILEQVRASTIEDENGRQITFRVSIGIAVSAAERGTESLDALLARADQALYLAKQQGRDRAVRDI